MTELPQSNAGGWALREVALGCLERTNWRRFQQWFDGSSPDDDYRNFFLNEGLFGVLPRQDNVRRPYAFD